MSDLFPDAAQGRGSKRHFVITVADLARDKALPVEFLSELGMTDVATGVLIPYKMADGSPAARQRRRFALKAKEGSAWDRGEGAPVPYGLWRLADAAQVGYLILVEGESDCWTLWYHGIPALGLPGADMAGKLQSEHLEAVNRLYAIHEPDHGGDVFCTGVTSRLREIGFTGQTSELRLTGAKDPNDLHQQKPEKFKELFQEAITRALPLASLSPSESTRSVGATDILRTAGLDALGTDPSSELLETALRRLPAALNGSDPLSVQLVRDGAIRLLEVVGVKAPARLVDAALPRSERGVPENSASDSNVIILSDSEPWPEPVDGATLLFDLAGTFRAYLVITDQESRTLALWTLHTYVLDAFTNTPRLQITSPTKQCGKSRLLEILMLLVQRALGASNITSAAFYRSIEQYKPTLAIDEADTFLIDRNELRGVINSGHSRAMAVVLRTERVGEQFQLVKYSTWAACAIAGIADLPDTIQDRSITICMRRKRKDETVARLRAAGLSQMEEQRRRCTRWAADNLERLRLSDPPMPEMLGDRQQDSWRPLIAIADAADGVWPKVARDAALALSGATVHSDDAQREILLADLRDLLSRDAVEGALTTSDILRALGEMDHRPWPEHNGGKPITARGLASLLKPFKIAPKTLKLKDGTTAKGYRQEWFHDAFERYIPTHDPVTNVTPNNVNDLSNDRLRNHTVSVTGVESTLSVHKHRDVTPVTDAGKVAQLSLPGPAADPSRVARERTNP
jgi:putative DNA primase/helicase